MAKRDWAEMPSLEGLSMDWEYKPESPLGKRGFARMSTQDLAKMFEGKNISVKMATEHNNFSCTLRDLSQGGMGVNIPIALKENQSVKVGLIIGDERITSIAQVRHIDGAPEDYRVGLKFLNISEGAQKFISDIYTAKVLRHAM